MISVKSKTRQGFKNIFFINFKAQQSPPPSVGLLLILWGLFFMVYMISVKSRHRLKVSSVLVYMGIYGVYDFSEKKKPAQSLSPVSLRGGWSYNMVYIDFSEKCR